MQQCEFRFKGYIQKDSLVHLGTILFPSVYNKCYDIHREYIHKLMDIDQRTNTVIKCTNVSLLWFRSVKIVKNTSLLSFILFATSLFYRLVCI